jgi:hypothetical protein
MRVYMVRVDGFHPYFLADYGSALDFARGQNRDLGVETSVVECTIESDRELQKMLNDLVEVVCESFEEAVSGV